MPRQERGFQPRGVRADEASHRCGPAVLHDGGPLAQGVSKHGGLDVTVMGIAKFERFFRNAAGVTVDKDDLKRYSDFVNSKLHDLLLIGEATAKANLRDIVEPWDLPVTKGLQETLHVFKKMDEEIELAPILEHLAALPPLDLAISAETEARLPVIAGGLSVALARTFKVIDPALKTPHALQWERAFEIFNLLL